MTYLKISSKKKIIQFTLELNPMIRSCDRRNIIQNTDLILFIKRKICISYQ